MDLTRAIRTGVPRPAEMCTMDLEPGLGTWISIDHRVRGLGTASCGPDTLEPYRIPPGSYEWAYLLQPIL